MKTRSHHAQVLREAAANRDSFELYGEIVRITSINTEAIGQMVWTDPKTGETHVQPASSFKDTFYLSNGGRIVIHRRAF